MAYHYKTKELIVAAIHDRLSTDQKQLMAEMNVVPLFEYVDHYLRKTFELQQRYSFFFTDMLEIFRAYPEISSRHAQLIQWQKQQYQLMLEFNKNRGVFDIPEIEGQTRITVDQLWMVTYMYHTYRVIDRRDASPDEYCRLFWGVCIPLLTDTGSLEYEQLKQLTVR